MTAAATGAWRSRKVAFDDRRMEVLRAAAKCFAEQGYNRATLEDIAGALNMRRPALYHYAKSKDELLKACMDVARDTVEASLGEAERQPTGLEQLHYYFRAHVAAGCDVFVRCFLMIDGRDVSEDIRGEQETWRRLRNRRIEAMLKAGMKDGTVAEGDAVHLRRLLFAVMNAVPLWIKSTNAKTIRKAADEAFESFVSGLGSRSS